MATCKSPDIHWISEETEPQASGQAGQTPTGIHESAEAETARLVGFGFRGWLNGYRDAQIQCWASVWSAYASKLPPETAETVVNALAAWVRSVHEAARRDIEVCETGCETFCQDECIAISIIAAAQNDTCPAMRACAFALLGTSDIDPVIASAEAFAQQLRAAGKNLSPHAIASVLSAAPPAPELRLN